MNLENEQDVIQNLELKHLNIKNYKCFGESTIIGPFNQITGIIGPNGTGKSSITESIQFVLAKDLFMHEQFFQYDQILNSTKNKEDIEVLITFGNDQQQIEYKRSLNRKNESKFFVNQKGCTKEEYVSSLKKQNLNPFGILSQEQKQIFTSLDSKKLMIYLEKISGSFELQNEYKKAQQKLQKIESKIFEINENLKTLRKDKQNAKFLVQSNEQAEKLIDNLDQTQQELFELTVGFYDFKKRNIDQKENKLREQKNVLENKINKLSTEMLLNNNENSRNNTVELENQLNEFYLREEEINNNIKELESKISEKTIQVNILQKDINFIHKKKLEQKKQHIDKLNKNIDELQEQLHQMKNSKKIRLSIKTEKQLQKFLLQYQSLENEIKVLQQGITEREQKEEQLAQKLNQLQSNQNILHNQVDNIDRQIVKLESRMVDFTQLDKSKQTHMDRIQDIKVEIAEIQGKKDQLTKEKEDLERKQYQQKHQNIKNGKFQNLLKDMQNQLPNFYGQLRDIVRAVDRKYSLASGMSLKSILDYLVIKDEQTASIVSKILTNNGFRKNIIILDNCPQKEEQELTQLRVFIGSQNHLVYDLIEFKIQNKQLKKYLAHFLRSNVVTEDFKTAIDLKKSLKDKIKQIVTVSGQIISQNGIEAYGNQDTIPYKVRQFIQEHYQFENIDYTFDIATLEKKLQELDDSELKIELSTLERKMLQEKCSKDQVMQELESLKHMSKNIFKEKQQILEQIEKDDKNFYDLRQEISQKKQIMIQAKERQNQLSQQFIEENKDIQNVDILQKLIIQYNSSELEIVKIQNQISYLQIQIKENEFGKDEKFLEDQQNLLQQKQTEIDELQLEYKSNLKTKQNFDIDYENILQRIKENKKIIEQHKMDRLIQMKELNQMEEDLIKLNQRINDKIQEKFSLNYQLQQYTENQQLQGIKLSQGLIKQTQNNAQDENYLENIIKENRYFTKEQFMEMDKQQFKKYRIEKEQQIQRIQKRLQKLTFNFTDDDLLEKEKLKVQDLNGQLKEKKINIQNLLQKEEDLKKQLEQITKTRNLKLNFLLNPLKLILNNLYKFVNCDERAQSSILIENPFKPFQGGLIFNAVPPQKAYTVGTDSLSTGESSLANLAFFLSINEIIKTPFIVLDEIDANLDFNNVQKFISTFGKYSQQKQVVFISHKPYVYKHAQVLLGITKDHENNQAVCFSLDLTKYEQLQFLLYIYIQN